MPDTPVIVDGAEVPESVVTRAVAAVAVATRSAIYDPENPGVIETLADARDEQIRAYLALEAHETAMAAAAGATVLGRPLSSASIGGASWTADTSASAVPERFRLDAGGGLCMSAWEILVAGGLTGNPVGHRG